MPTNKQIVIGILIGIPVALMAGCVACVALLGVAGSSVEQAINAPVTSTSKPSYEPLILVTAQELATEYEANELAADAKYKNKVIAVSGQVDSIQEMFGQKFVILRGKGLSSVQCFFKDEHASKLSKLKKGQQVAIQGTNEGKSINVTLQDCFLL